MYRPNDFVRTPNGRGYVQWFNANGSIHVWINAKEFSGELPPKFTPSSPTIGKDYQPEELEFA